MFSIIIWTLLFSLSTAFAIVLVGDRNLISGNLFDINNLFRLLFSLKFILSIFLSFIARISFIFLNNNILKHSYLSDNATTIASLLTSISFIFIILLNYLFLAEKLSFSQAIGTVFIMIGVFVILK